MTFILELKVNEISLPKISHNGTMKNLLIQLEEFSIEHFITKSYITADFETDECRNEYHIYHKCHESIGKWSDRSIDYPYLKSKPFSSHELRWFRKNIDRYKLELSNIEGNIWINKSIGFKKNPKRKSNQISLFD